MKRFYILLANLIFATSLVAQTVPNGSFEDWNNANGYPEPDNWGTFNIFSLFSGSDFGVTQETPGAVGSYYARLSCTADLEGAPTPAFAFSGTFNPLAGSSGAGFPVNNLPNFLSGQFRSSINGDDYAVIGCFFTRWNASAGVSDTLAIGALEIDESQSSWTNFDLPIVPMMTGTPDSCTIVLVAGAGALPEVGNYLDVDDLHFTGGVSSIDEQTNSMFSIYPNPMNDLLMIDLSTMENSNDVSLFDTQGRLLERWQLGATRTTLNVAHLPAGSYIMHVSNRRGRWTQSLIKN